MIVGTGVDIISTARVRDLIARYGDRFIARWFTPQEVAYCSARSRPHIHFAARLAAKEAAVKALDIAWNAAMCWRDISVVNSGTGAPSVTLARCAREAAEGRGIAELHLALSHCGEYAVATVVAEA